MIAFCATTSVEFPGQTEPQDIDPLLRDLPARGPGIRPDLALPDGPDCFACRFGFWPALVTVSMHGQAWNHCLRDYFPVPLIFCQGPPKLLDPGGLLLPSLVICPELRLCKVALLADVYHGF